MAYKITGDNHAAEAAAARRRQEAIEQARRQAAERARREAAEEARRASERTTRVNVNAFSERNGIDASFTRNHFSFRFPGGDDAAQASATRAAAGGLPPAERIIRASVDDPVGASRLLEHEIKSSRSVGERRALVNDPKVAAAVGNIARRVTGGDAPGEAEVQQTLASLSRAAEAAESHGSRIIARAFAEQVSLPDTDAPVSTFAPGSYTYALGNPLENAVEEGAGASFAVHLSQELQRAGNTAAGFGVAKFTDRALRDVREDFARKADEVEELNRLLLEAGGFVSDLPDDDPRVKNAVDAFMERHREEFAAFDEAGRKLASTFQGAHEAGRNPFPPTRDYEYGGLLLTDEPQSVLKEFVRAGQTAGGQEAVADALAKQADGDATFLDAVRDTLGNKRLENADDAAKYAGAVANIITKSVGSRVVRLADEGREKEAAKLFLALRKNHEFFGIERGEMDGIAGELRKIWTGGDGSIDELRAKFNALDGGTPGVRSNAAGAQALKGLGLVVALAGNAEAWKNFGSGDPLAKVQTIGNTLGMGVDAGSLVLDVFGRDTALAARVLENAGTVLGGVGVVFDGISAVKNFREHKFAEGVAATASTAGGAILTLRAVAGAARVTPGLQIAGVVLTVGAEVTNKVAGKLREHRHQNELKEFLIDLGVGRAQAEKLSDITGDGKNMGTFIRQVAPYLSAAPSEVLDHIKGMEADRLRELVLMTQGLDFDSGAARFDDFDGNDLDVGEMKSSLLRWPFKDEVMPNSLYGAASWMRQHGFAPPLRPYNGPH